MNKMVTVFPTYHQGKRINVPNPEFGEGVSLIMRASIFGLHVLADESAEGNVGRGAFNYLNHLQKINDKIAERRRDMEAIARRKQLEGGINSEYTFG